MKKILILLGIAVMIAIFSCGSAKNHGPRCSKYNKKHWNNNFTRGWNSY